MPAPMIVVKTAIIKNSTSALRRPTTSASCSSRSRPVLLATATPAQGCASQSLHGHQHEQNGQRKHEQRELERWLLDALHRLARERHVASFAIDGNAAADQ